LGLFAGGITEEMDHNKGRSSPSSLH